MKLIVGLGNPGKKYADTRHNAGRRLIESIAHHSHLTLSKKRQLQASITSFEMEGHPTALAFPEVFMNVSGEAVRALVRSCSVDVKQDLLVVVDDTALPFGRMRLRPRGSDGGHNGLKSVSECLETQDYARLRLGIGMPDLPSGKMLEISLESYVLAPFTAEEHKALPSILSRGREACHLWIGQPMENAMNAINSYPAMG